MTFTKEQIWSAALQLDPTDREALAEELWLSLTPSEQDEIDKAWLAEAYRRDAEIKAGRMSTTPVDEVIDRLMRKAQK
jgi:putative addiction module component (TIGR02574 family)